ncbi:uncharacterized protein PAC_02146 [Phialocephala subalpina]|uniref:Dienelactone hydrolase domain-containing protein n=1 Tax=Phialocephala subalpina TaxID=576137 RepID=A0A1L7WHM3_9HELO|nr:uncharacterized protein PAC_02146 [Phialocephala subalpina]
MTDLENFPTPGPCAFSGFQCEGKPRGVDEKDEDGYGRYISMPRGNYDRKAGIIFFTDAKGIWHNSRVFADQFADAGYTAYIINSTGIIRAEGEPYVPPAKIPGFKKPTRNDITTMLHNADNWLRAKQGCHKIGGVGAGGVPILNELSDKKTLYFNAAFIAHPTNTTKKLFDDISAPLSVAFGDNDSRIDQRARHAAENGLIKSSQPYQISLYSHVHHGFAARRAFTTEAEVFAKKQTFIQAITCKSSGFMIVLETISQFS